MIEEPLNNSQQLAKSMLFRKNAFLLMFLQLKKYSKRAKEETISNKLLNMKKTRRGKWGKQQKKENIKENRMAALK